MPPETLATAFSSPLAPLIQEATRAYFPLPHEILGCCLLLPTVHLAQTLTSQDFLSSATFFHRGMSNLNPAQGSDGLQVHVNRGWDNYPEHYVPPQVEPPYKQDGPAAISSRPITAPSNSTLCGLSRRGFIVTAAIVIAIVLAGALGGGLGGGLSSRSNGSGQCGDSDTSNSPPTTEMVTVTVFAESTASATSEAPSSSSTGLGHDSDCPSSDGTDYTSTEFTSGSNGPVPNGAKNGLKFTKICGTDLHGTNLAQSTYSTFEECIDLCASYNFWSGSTDCKGVTYNSIGSCWIKTDLASDSSDGIDSAVLADSG